MYFKWSENHTNIIIDNTQEFYKSVLFAGTPLVYNPTEETWVF